jgi:hypothetical protein
MKRRTALQQLLMMVVLGALAAPGLGQLDDLQPPEDPGPPAGAQEDPLRNVFDDMTEEEMEAFIKQALKRRLINERMQVLTHIEDGMLLRYMDEDVDKARKILRDEKAENSQSDNIDRIIRAYAAVEPDLAKPYQTFLEARKLKEAGKEEEAREQSLAAAAKLKEKLNANQSSYYSAAKHYLYAQMLAEAGKGWDAIDAYGNVIANMPDRLSFAAGAALASAQAFEDMGRGYYALDMYAFIWKNYPGTLDTKQLEHVMDRLEALKEMYGDPMGAVTKRMDEVRKRLDALDSGQKTQEKQEEIVAILTDLIKVKEESKKSDPNQEKKQNNQQEKGESSGEKQQGKAGQQASGKKSQSQSQQAKGTSPAKSSYLPQGISGRIEIKSESREGVEESGDWAKLPPRKQEQLKEMLKRNLSPKHREAIREYLKGTAAGG